MTGRVDSARATQSPLRTDEHLKTPSVTRSVELTDTLKTKGLHGAEGARVEGRHSDAKRPGRELCSTEGQACGDGMTPEPLSNELRTQPSARVECLVVIVPTWYLSVGPNERKPISWSPAIREWNPESGCTNWFGSTSVMS